MVYLFCLSFLDPAEIKTKTQSQEVVEGGEISLFCNATGIPQPHITWTKKGSDIMLSSSETLNLTRLASEDNGAVYKCKVENNLGSAEANATVTVLCEY